MNHFTSGPGPKRQFEARFLTSPVPWRERVDAVTLGALIGSLLLAAALIYFGLSYARLAGWFEHPEVSSIPDQRLLTNIREDLVAKPALDAVSHQGDVYVSRKGGSLDALDPETGLWRDVSPPQTMLRNPDLVQLRSGCGDDPASDRATDCPDPESLWALGGDGSLLRYLDGKWTAVADDSAFVGALDEPTPGDVLTSAAISEDKQWLVLGAMQHGFGVYDVGTRRWRAISSEAYEQLPALDVSRLAFWGGFFWAGGPNGVARIQVANNIEVNTVEELTGSVIDFVVRPGGGLWVLLEKGCDGEGVCTQLVRFTDPLGTPELLVDQQRLFTDLKLEDLFFADLWEETLVLAGQAGAFVYQLPSHTWDRVIEQPVRAALPMEGERGVFLAYDGGLALLTPDGNRIREIEGKSFRRLHAGAPGEVLALSASGDVWSMSLNGPIKQVFPGGPLPIQPNFSSALPLGDITLFLGERDGLVHHVRTREYRPTISRMPRWLLRSGVKPLATRDHMWFAVPSGAKTRVYSATKNDVLAGDLSKMRVIREIEDSTAAFRVWEGSSVVLATDDGRPWLISETGGFPLVGAPLNRASNLRLNDVTSYLGGAAFATSSGIKTYSYSKRAWSEMDVAGGMATDQLASIENRLYTTTPSGRLFLINNGSRELIGGDLRFKIPDRLITDVISENNRLFIAGDGRVDVYDGIKRRVIANWRLPQGRDVRLEPLAGQGFIALSGGVANINYQGNQGVATKLDPNAGPVRSLYRDSSHIWTLRQRGDFRWLKGYPVDDPLGGRPICYFRNPTAGRGVRSIGKAVALRGDLSAVMTNRGLRFYHKRAHTWMTPENAVLPSGGRMWKVGQALVLAGPEPNPADLTIIPIRTIQIPDPCTDLPVRFQRFRYPAIGLDIDPGAGAVAFVTMDGTVREWRNGQLRDILPPAMDGPPTDRFRRVWVQSGAQPDYLFLSTSDSLYTYHLGRREWRNLLLRTTQNTNFKDFDIAFTSNSTAAVTASSENGRWFVGSWESENPDVITLEAFGDTGRPDRRMQGVDLVDVHDTDKGIWTFVFKNRIAYFDPDERVWTDQVSLPGAGKPHFAYIEDRAYILSEDRSRLWVARDRGDHPTEFRLHNLSDPGETAVDERGNLWIFSERGVLRRLSLISGNGELIDEDQPFLLDPTTVSSAYSWDDRYVFFQTDRDLLIYDRRERTPLAFTAGEGFTGLREVVSFNDSLWFLNGNELLMLNREPVNADLAGARRIQGVSAAVRDASGFAWARFEDGWRYFQRDEFKKPANWDDFELYVTEGGKVIGLADDLQPRPFAAQSYRHPELPGDWLSGELLLLIQGVEDHWWAIRNNRLVVLKAGGCEGGKCLETQADVALPNSFDLTAQPFSAALGSDRITITNSIRQAVTLSKKMLGGYNLEAASGSMLPGRLIENWDNLQRLVAELPNGASAFDPIQGLAADRERLVGRTPGGSRLLAANGAPLDQLPPPPALNVNWLAWKRESNQFTLQTNRGPRNISPQNALQDGTFFFQGISALMPHSDGGIYLANDAGIWRYPGVDATLESESLQFRPLTWNAPTNAAHQRFFGAGGVVDVTGNPADDMHSVRFGEITLSEMIVRADVSGSALSGDVFSSRGFVWDIERQGVQYRDGDIWIRDGSGLHPLMGYSDFERGDVLEKMPSANADNAPDPVQSWRSGNDPSGVGLVQTPEGLAFNADLLIDAGVAEDRHFLNTQAFLHIGSQAEIVSWSGEIKPGLDPSARLRIRREGATPRLWLQQSSSLRIWDGSRFVNPPARAAEQIIAVLPADQPRIRFIRTASGIRREVRLQEPGGQDQWRPFNLVDGRFPFDVVTAIASQGKRLWVGTRAGLQIYFSPEKASFGNDSVFLNVGARSNGRSMPVERIGAAGSNSNRLIAVTATGAVMADNDGPVVSTTRSDMPNQTTRLEGAFWRWTLDSGGLRGFYKASNSASSQTSVRLTDGAFSHDRIRDLIVHRGKAFALWWNGSVTRHYDSSLDISKPVEIFSVDGQNPISFLTFSGSREPLLAGKLFLRLQNGGALEFDQQWRKAAPEVESAIRARLQGASLFRGAALRLTQSGSGAPRFQRRTAGGDWLTLNWGAADPRFPRDRRLSIDRWYDFAVQDNYIWALTAQGLVRFFRGNGGRFELNPDDIPVIPYPNAERRALPTETRFQDGAILIRFDHSRVYRCDPNDLSSGSCKPVDNDPFSERDWVTASDNQAWSWRMSGRIEGESGQLEATFLGEPVQIVQGRFPWDGLRSIAFSSADHLDFSTNQGGWFRAKDALLHPKHLVRPQIPEIDPATIRLVRSGLVNGVPALGLLDPDGSWTRIGQHGMDQSADFPSLQAQDGFWTYTRTQSGLNITADRIQGEPESRQLIQGRFSDQIITGPPTTASFEGGRHLLPTFAGILETDLNLIPQTLHTGPWPGLSAGKTPAIVYLPNEDQPMYLASDGFRLLNDDRLRIDGLNLDRPDAEIIAVEHGPAQSTRVRWRGDTAGWSLVEPVQNGGSFHGQPVNLSRFPRFIQNRVKWGDPQPWLNIEWDGKLRAGWPDQPASRDIPIPADFKWVAPVFHNQRLFLIGESEFLQIDLEQTMIRSR